MWQVNQLLNKLSLQKPKPFIDNEAFNFRNKTTRELVDFLLSFDRDSDIKVLISISRYPFNDLNIKKVILENDYEQLKFFILNYEKDLILNTFFY